MSGNKKIITSDWLAHPFQFDPNFCVMHSHVIIQGEDCDGCKKLIHFLGECGRTFFMGSVSQLTRNNQTCAACFFIVKRRNFPGSSSCRLFYKVR
ncbi:hypothetical protein BMS3Bbin14_01454 [bacterium BMS3Bbin14]|nr:hypothetical protein BMS3Abin13_00678 [bacterium BMS3Abin13]GBE52974.1 hypothetical protein BMS3Bbin14_01454 [bacterium BMS3Bbin14]